MTAAEAVAGSPWLASGLLDVDNDDQRAMIVAAAMDAFAVPLDDEMDLFRLPQRGTNDLLPRARYAAVAAAAVLFGLDAVEAGRRLLGMRVTDRRGFTDRMGRYATADPDRFARTASDALRWIVDDECRWKALDTERAALAAEREALRWGGDW